MLLLFAILEVILQRFPQEGPILLSPALQRLLMLLLANKESALTISSKPNAALATQLARHASQANCSAAPCVCTSYI